MTKFAKRLTAALTTAAVLAASLVSTASAYTASSGSYITKPAKGTYTYHESSVTYNVKYEAGPFYNSYTKNIDGYTTLENYQPSGTSITMRKIKTRGILRYKHDAEPKTWYIETPLSNNGDFPFESNSTYRVGVAANYNVGGLAISEVSNTSGSSNYFVEVSAAKQTSSTLTAYGNVRYQKGSNVIAGYYEVVNY